MSLVIHGVILKYICILQPNGVDTDCWGMKNHMTLFDMEIFQKLNVKNCDTDGDGREMLMKSMNHL